MGIPEPYPFPGPGATSTNLSAGFGAKEATMYEDYDGNWHEEAEDYREYTSVPCRVCGVPMTINGVPTHVCIYPMIQKPNWLARILGSGQYCLECGHMHDQHLQPWVIEWAKANVDNWYWRRLGALVVVDFITGAGPL